MKLSKATRLVPLTPAVALAAMAIGLASCATSAPTDSEDVGEVILQPGETKTCISTPCTVWFQMPEGTGTYPLFEDGGTKLGDYPAGEKVQIGNFWSNHSFRIPDSDFPEAHLITVGSE